MRNFYDVHFTEVIHRHYRLSILADSEEEAIELAKSDDGQNFEDKVMDSYDYRAEKIDDHEARD